MYALEAPLIVNSKTEMPDTDLEFTALERAVLAGICEMHPADCAALQAQLAAATVLRRDNTGAGFFTYFDVDRSAASPVSGRRLRNGPEAQIDGFAYGMGFILWLVEGYANNLEGYSNGGESTRDIALDKVKFKIAKD